MTAPLLWLPEVLQAAGLKVAEVDGWRTRGVGQLGDVVGVMCHHTAGPPNGNMPSLHTLIHGRPDLRGPLAQIGLGRDGTCYVIAAGRCQHAGAGSWQGVTEGNSRFIAIEAENTGGANDLPWPEVQMQAYRHAAAALLRKLGRPASFCVGHGEYALPPRRKVDPSFDMTAFRVAVAAILAGTLPPPPPIPAAESGGAGRPTLRRGAQGPAVEQLQRLLGLPADGDFGPNTEAAVRAFQRRNGLVPDGIVGPRTWPAVAAAPVA